MMTLLKKELRLTASLLSYLFIAFGVMAIIPGYPILLAAFFVCFGVFHSFQAGREANDTLYTAMLPVDKADVVKAKIVFTVFIQLCAFVLMFVLTVLRMLYFTQSEPYLNNVLMNANWAFLGYVLLVYAAFNLVFICRFFKTAYNVGVPFLFFCIAAFALVGVGETLHHLPGFAALNATTGEPCQLIVLAIGVVCYLLGTLLALRISQKRFERIDL